MSEMVNALELHAAEDAEFLLLTLRDLGLIAGQSFLYHLNRSVIYTHLTRFDPGISGQLVS